MIDQSGLKGRVVAAAMRIAAERPWGDVTLLDIAEAAGVSLSELRGAVGSKANVLTAFNKAIDDEVLRKAQRPAVGSPARDRLFEVLMARFDAMQPYKSAIRSILKSPTADGPLLWSLVRSQHWMLAAAGLDSEGTIGRARMAGLASVYSAAFRTWLDDDDPGLARTMAVLDRRLRSGERSMQSLEGVCGSLSRMRETVSDALRGRRARTTPTGGDEPAAASSAYEPPREPGMGSTPSF
jgi:AcrR family transcriptional regulator